MNLLIFFIIILTIVLIVYYYNCNDANSASLIVAIPLLGVIQYMNLREENYNTKEYKILQKEGIIGSNEDNEIKAIEEENDNILNFIIENDSMGFIDENKQDRLTFIKNEFQKMDKDERIFNKFNKYFMFKENIEDPKLLKLKSEYYKKDIIDNIKNNIINSIKFNDIKQKLKVLTIDKFESKLTKNEQIKVSMQKIRNGVEVTNKINTYDLSNKNNIKSIIAYMNTMLSINKSENRLSEYLDKYNNYDNYIKEYDSKLYDINNIQLFNSLTKDDKIIPNENSKQLFYIINSRKRIRNNNLNPIYYIKVIEEIKTIKNNTQLDDLLTGKINILIYSLFILYNVNLNKINNIKYKNENKKLYGDVLNDLKETLKLKISNDNNKNAFRLVLAEIVKSKKNNTRPEIALPKDLLDGIVNFDKVKLNSKLQEAQEKYDNNNENNDIVDNIHFIKILIEKYKKMLKTYKNIGSAIHKLNDIDMKEISENLKKCYISVLFDNSINFMNIINYLNKKYELSIEENSDLNLQIKNNGRSKSNTYIKYIKVYLNALELLKISNNNEDDAHKITISEENIRSTITKNKIKISKEYIKISQDDDFINYPNTKMIETERDILKILIPYYKELNKNEYYIQNKEITMDIENNKNKYTILNNLKIINEDYKLEIKEGNKMHIECINGEIPILAEIKNNLRILNNELKQKELEYEFSHNEINNIQNELNDINNKNVESAVENCIDDVSEMILTNSSEYLSLIQKELEEKKTQIEKSIIDILNKLKDPNLSEDDKNRLEKELYNNVLELLNTSSKLDEIAFNNERMSLTTLKCQIDGRNKIELYMSKIKDLNILVNSIKENKEDKEKHFYVTLYKNTIKTYEEIIYMIDTYIQNLPIPCPDYLRTIQNAKNISPDDAAIQNAKLNILRDKIAQEAKGIKNKDNDISIDDQAEAKISEQAKLQAEAKTSEQAKLQAEAKTSEQAKLQAEAKTSEQAKPQMDSSSNSKAETKKERAERQRLAKEEDAKSSVKPILDNNDDSKITIIYSNEEKEKIKKYKNETEKINKDIIKMIENTDTEFKNYKDDNIRYNYLNLLQNKEYIILKDIVKTITDYENSILNEFIKKTKYYITNKSSNNGIYDFVLDNNIYDITVNEYKTKSILDKERNKQKTLLFVFGQMIHFILDKFTTDEVKKNYKETSINKIINICQVNKEIIQEVDKNLKLENKTNINDNLNNFYKSLEIKDFNNLNLIQSKFNELEKKYKNVNFEDCDKFKNIFQNINKGNDLEELIKTIKMEYTKKNKQLDSIKTTKFKTTYDLGIDDDLILYAENFGKIDYINLFICISQYINKFNLELFKEYLSNIKRIELYEQLLPFEKYINLQIKDLKELIAKLENDNRSNVTEIESLRVQLVDAERTKQNCDSSLELKIKELEDIKKILNGRLTEIEYSLVLTNDNKKELTDQQKDVEIRLSAINKLIEKENENNAILTNRNTSLSSEIDMLNQKLEVIKMSNSELNTTRERIEKESFYIQDQVDFIQRQIDSTSTSNINLTLKKDKLQSQLIAKTATNSELEKESSDINGQIQAIEEQIRTTSTSNNELKDKKEILERELIKINEKLSKELGLNNDIIAKNKDTSERLSAIEQRIMTDIKSAVEAKNVADIEITRIRSELQSKEAQYLKTIEDLQKSNSALQLQINSDINKYNDLVKKHENTAKKTKELVNNIIIFLNKINNKQYKAPKNYDDVKTILEDHTNTLKDNEKYLKNAVVEIKELLIKYSDKDIEEQISYFDNKNKQILLISNDVVIRILFTLIKEVKDKDNIISNLKTTNESALISKEAELTTKYNQDIKELQDKHLEDLNNQSTTNAETIRVALLAKEVELKDKYERDIAALQSENKDTMSTKEAELSQAYTTQISDLKAVQSDVINQQTREYNEIKERLETEIQKLTRARDEAVLEGVIATKEIELSELNQKIKKLEADHTRRISDQDLSFKEQIAGIATKHQTEINKLKQEYQMRLEDKDSQILNINLLNNKKIADLMKSQSDTLQTLKSELVEKSNVQSSAAVNNANTEYQLELRKKEAECEGKILQIKTELNDKYTTEIASINSKYSDIISDLNREKIAIITSTEEKAKEDATEKTNFSNNVLLLTRINEEQGNTIIKLEQEIKKIKSDYEIDTRKLSNDILSLMVANEKQGKTIKGLETKINNDKSNYNTDMQKLTTDIKSLTLANETQGETIRRLEEEIVNNNLDYKTDTTQLAIDISLLKEINKKQEDTISQLNNNIRILVSTSEEQVKIISRVKQEIEILKERQSDDIKLLGEKYKNELAQEIEKLKLEHKRETEQLIAENGFEIERINKEHLDQLSTLNSTNEALKLEAINANALALEKALAKQKNELEQIHKLELHNKIEASNLTNGTTLEELNKKHALEIKELNKKHALEIKELNKKYEIDIEKTRNSVKTAANFASNSILQGLKKTQLNELAKLKEKYELEIIKAKDEVLKEANLNNSLELEEIRNIHAKELDELYKQHEIELRKVKEDILKETETNNNLILKNLYKAHSDEIERLNRKHELDLKNKTEAAKIAATLVGNSITTTLTNTQIDELKRLHTKELEDLENYNKTNIINLKRDIDELEQHIISLQETNRQIRDEILKSRQKLNQETESKNILVNMLSSYLDKYENSEMGLKDAILEEYKKIKPSTTNSLENVLNTKLYMILNRHKEIINELNGCKELGTLRIREISKLIKKVKGNLIEKIVDEVDENEIDLNNIKVDETQAKYLNKLDELLNKLIQEKYNLYKQQEDSVELINDILDDYDNYKQNKEIEIQRINGEILHYTKEIEEINNNINNITEEFITNSNNKLPKEFNQQIKKLKEEIHKKNNIIKEKNDALSDIDKKYKLQIKLLQEENVELKNTCKKDKEKLEKSITNLHSYYSKEILNLKSIIAEYSSKYELTETDKEQIKLKKLSIDFKYENEIKLYNSMKSKLETLESKLLFTERELADCLSAKRILSSEIAEIKAEKEAVRIENENIKTSLEQNIRDAELLRIENTRLKETILEMKRKCSKVTYLESDDVDSEDVYIYVDKKLLESKKEQDKNKYKESGKIFTLDDIKQTKNKKINTLFKKPNDKYL